MDDGVDPAGAFELTAADDRLSVTLDDRGRVVTTELSDSEPSPRSADG